MSSHSKQEEKTRILMEEKAKLIQHIASNDLARATTAKVDSKPCEKVDPVEDSPVPSTSSKEKLKEILAENAKLKEAKANRGEELQKLMEENAKLKEARASTATRQALKKTLEENAKLKEAAHNKSLAERKLKESEEATPLKEKVRSSSEVLKSELSREEPMETDESEDTSLIKQRKKDIAYMIEQFKDVQRVDLCFLVDLTGSMLSCISSVKTNINTIINEVTTIYPDLQVRISFVGYRDIEFGVARLATLDFVESLTKFDEFIRNLSVIDGDDEAEDVLGGIHQAIKLDWKFPTRVIVHFADAPCHGREFHDGCSDKYPSGDPNGLKIEQLLDQIMHLSIQYWFVHLNESTKKMVEVFKEKSELDIIELDMHDGFDTMVKSVSTIICKSILKVDKASRIRTDRRIRFADISTRSKSTVIPHLSQSFEEIEAIYYNADLIRCKSDLYRLVKTGRSKTVQLKMAKTPFAEGKSRKCYHGKTVRPDKNIVIKEFKNSVMNKDFKHFEGILETSAVSLFLSEQFNNSLSSIGRAGRKLNFIIPQIIEVNKIENTKKLKVFYLIEPHMEGRYQKFSNNFGLEAEKGYHDLVNAFTHWSYEFTDGYMMVADIQGVSQGLDFKLIDPVIHYEQRWRSKGLERFGSSNMGKKGMKIFFRTHVCNYLCKALGLHKS